MFMVTHRTRVNDANFSSRSHQGLNVIEEVIVLDFIYNISKYRIAGNFRKCKFSKKIGIGFRINLRN